MLKEVNKKSFLVLSLLVFLIMLYKHINVELGIGDDLWFLDMANQTNLIEYLVTRYNTWTSRLIIESLMLILLKLPSFVWIVLDSLIFVLIYYSMIKILHAGNKSIVQLIVFCLVILFPFGIFGEAGWYATTINYAWPLACGLYSLSFMNDFFYENKVSSLRCSLLIMCIIFATNQEQMCALVFGFYFIFLVYQYITKKHINKLALLVLLFSGAMILFHLTCPGNLNRKIVETNAYYEYYKNYDIKDKFVLGFLSTFSSIINRHEIIVVLFLSIVIFLGIRNSDIKVRIASIIPLSSYLLAILFLNFDSQGNVSTMINRFMSPMNEIPYDVLTMIYIFIILLETCLILYVLYKCLEWDVFLYSTIVILAAFASRFILGLSASIFVSGIRTFINLYVLLLMIDMILLFKIKPFCKEEK